MRLTCFIIMFFKARPLFEPLEETEGAESLQYSFETIRIATDDFSAANKLGQGGFGPVYRVSLIKRLILYLACIVLLICYIKSLKLATVV